MVADGHCGPSDWPFTFSGDHHYHHHRFWWAVQLRGCSSLDLHADCKLFYTGFLILCLWTSFSVPLFQFLSIWLFSFLSFHPSLPVSLLLFLFLPLCCWWWLFFLAGEEARRWFGPSDTAHFPLFLSLPLPFPSLMVYSWPMTLRPQQFIGVSLPRRYANCSSIPHRYIIASECVTDWMITSRKRQMDAYKHNQFLCFCATVHFLCECAFKLSFCKLMYVGVTYHSSICWFRNAWNSCQCSTARAASVR